tara:strand:+ start:22 stop:426 length:405 start_codon:yes stop_codon:yes gene_type:complete
MSNTKATGVAYLDPEFTTCYASEEIGYALAGQGAVTQETSKSTGVTVNASMGQITTNGATLNTLTNVTFTLTNRLISAKDVIILNVGSGATSGAYNCWISSMSAGTCTITLRNISGGNLSEAVIINFAVIHGAS